MAIKFSSKEPAKVDSTKVVKQTEVKRVSVETSDAPDDADVSETVTKRTTRKSK